MTSALNEAEGHQGFTASAFEVLRLLAVYLGRPEQGAHQTQTVRANRRRSSPEVLLLTEYEVCREVGHDGAQVIQSPEVAAVIQEARCLLLNSRFRRDSIGVFRITSEIRLLKTS